MVTVPRGPILRSAFIKLMAVLAIGGLVPAQICPELCCADPRVALSGIVPPGVTVNVTFQASTSGTGILLFSEEVGLICPGCTPCSGEVFTHFNAGGMGGTTCYTPDGGGIYAKVPEGTQTTTTKTSCDGDPQEINVHFFSSGADCGNLTSSADFTAEVRLYCVCLNPPE